jgi:hypothetical protein
MPPDCHARQSTPRRTPLNHHVTIKRPRSLLPDHVRRLSSSWSLELTRRSSALNETARKAAKAKNTKGNPFKLPSKILAIAPDLQDGTHVYVAEAAGNVKRINLEVGQTCFRTASGPRSSRMRCFEL